VLGGGGGGSTGLGTWKREWGGAWVVRVQRWSAGGVRRKDWEGEWGWRLAGEGAALECGRREKEGLGKGVGGGAWRVRVQRRSAGGVRRKNWEGELGSGLESTLLFGESWGVGLTWQFDLLTY
jgi:hypothetical protein